jgi:large subunit ribosomal protein L19
MLKRRLNVDIPEFYVGSVLAVTVSDPYAPGKVSRFVGICILKEGQGLRANFTLRNYIENEGVEIRYDLYNPTLRSVDVLRLEKRLDSHLMYLRDADPEYSTFPFDMETEVLPDGAPVPVNPLKVRMKPYPWTSRWEVEMPLLRGVDKIEGAPTWYYNRSRNIHNPLEKFDLMLQYRDHVPEDDQLEIWEQVKHHSDVVEDKQRMERRKKMLLKVKTKE